VNLHELVIHSAAAHPGRLAVADPTASLRYGELDERANALAHRLRGLGIGRGDRVRASGASLSDDGPLVYWRRSYGRWASAEISEESTSQTTSR
jgi:non-ribosomal peptide synthetase component F